MRLSNPGIGPDIVQITVGSVNGAGTVSPASKQLHFGEAAPGPAITLPGGPTYTFSQIRYAFTSVDGRAVLWGKLLISGQPGAFQFEAFQWPALALPASTWKVVPTGAISVGDLNFSTMLFTNTAGHTSPITKPNPVFQFTDPATRIVYSGMAQLTINGPNGSTNPSSRPESLTWNFGGSFPKTDKEAGDWSSTPTTGQTPNPKERDFNVANA